MYSTITAAVVLEEFTGQEQAAINAIQGALTQLGSILAREVNAARDAITAGGYEVSATANTIPDLIRPDVIAIARWRWLISLPSLKALQTKEREKAFERAQDKLERIAEGKFNVPPATQGQNPRTGSWNSENRMNMRTHPVPRPPAALPTDGANTEND